LPSREKFPASEDAGYNIVKIILASSSPRRSEILRDAGIVCAIRATQIDEAALRGETAHAMVARLAEAKAREAVAQIRDDARECIVVGADTTVELDGEIFGKPYDAEQAREMLRVLTGRTHRVLTGIFLLRLPDNTARSAVESTAQGVAGRYIPRIEGCYFNVVGLPLARLYVLLRELGWRDEE
jgi:septum formation protein